jgi:PAS domain-containing protein
MWMMSPSSTPGERTARRAAGRRRMTAAFAAAFALLVSAAVASFLGVRRFKADSAALAGAQAAFVLAGPDARPALGARLAEARARLEADGRLLILAASAARGVGALVIVLAFLAARRYLGQRDDAEDALRLARDSALLDAEALRAAQEETRRAGERLQSVLDQVDAGVMLVGPDGSVPLFNRAAERLLGAWREQAESHLRGGGSLFEGGDPLARALGGETVVEARARMRLPFRRPDGFPAVASASPQSTPQGLAAGALLVFREAPGGPDGSPAK